MRDRPIQAGAGAGAIGAVVLYFLQLLMWKAQSAGPPTGVVFALEIFQLTGFGAVAVGGVAFWLAGLIWGALFAVIVRDHTAFTGMAFSLAPTLCALLIVMPLLNKPVFAGGNLQGILTPLTMNLLWGLLVGSLTPAIHSARQDAQRP